MGYSTREFTNAKRDHPLTFKDYETIAETVNYFSKQVHVNTHDIDFEAIKKLQKYGAELLDAIHVIQADYSKCNFFISRDTKLITSIKNNPLPDVRLGVRIIHPKEFLEIVGY